MPNGTRTRGIAVLDTAWERAGGLIPYIRAERKGGRTTHSDVMREAIAIGLDALEAKRERAEKGIGKSQVGRIRRGDSWK